MAFHLALFLNTVALAQEVPVVPELSDASDTSGPPRESTGAESPEAAGGLTGDPAVPAVDSEGRSLEAPPALQGEPRFWMCGKKAGKLLKSARPEEMQARLADLAPGRGKAGPGAKLLQTVGRKQCVDLFTIDSVQGVASTPLDAYEPAFIVYFIDVGADGAPAPAGLLQSGFQKLEVRDDKNRVRYSARKGDGEEVPNSAREYRVTEDARVIVFQVGEYARFVEHDTLTYFYAFVADDEASEGRALTKRVVATHVPVHPYEFLSARLFPRSYVPFGVWSPLLTYSVVDFDKDLTATLRLQPAPIGLGTRVYPGSRGGGRQFYFGFALGVSWLELDVVGQEATTAEEPAPTDDEKDLRFSLKPGVYIDLGGYFTLGAGLRPTDQRGDSAMQGTLYFTIGPRLLEDFLGRAREE